MVKSMGEARVATTLYLSGIAYRYEAEFPVPEKYQSEDGRRYFPDFYLPDDPDESSGVKNGIWYEHFAHDMNGGLPKEWDKDTPGSRARYRKNREWKERLHEVLGTRFVWTEYADMQRCMKDGTSFPELVLERVEKAGRTGDTDISEETVCEELSKMKKDRADASHFRITFEIDAWIRTSRQQATLEKARAATLSRREVSEEASALTRIATPVAERYTQFLEQSQTTDYEGTILTAWQYLRDGAIAPPWSVVLVDEYQDVNPAQAAFVHALLRPKRVDSPSTRARLTCVGDDWQAIFAFQGGDVDLIRDFSDPAGENDGFASRVALQQTYRFGQQLANTTRHFVTRSPDAIDRVIVGAANSRPDQRWPSSVVIASSRLTEAGRQTFGKGLPGLTGGVCAALSRIATQATAATVLVLGRRNVDIESVQRFGQRNRVGLDRGKLDRFASANNLRLSYATIHKAKGTEGDYVIFLDTGPPRAGERANVKALNRALSVFWNPDAFAEEERRIWYVALTRAKRKVYIIVDATAEAHSKFADELFHNVDGNYDVGEDELAEYLEPMQPLVPCPACNRNGVEGPVLAVRTGQNGSFAGCTSFSAPIEHRCGHTERLCGECKKGLIIRLGNGYAECQARECDWTTPLCGCPVQMPMVVRRNSQTGDKFWGCQRFPKGCRITVSMVK